MSELQRKRQRDVLLTTLIDLLVQILFLLLLAVVLVAPTADMQSTVAEARELEKSIGRTLPEIALAWRRLVDPDSLDVKYRDMEKERDSLRQRERDLESRLKSYEERFQALGDKPCWMSGMRPEALFLVRVFDDAIEVLPRWQPARISAVSDFAVPLQLLERRISITQFVSGFGPVYERSKALRCRHYVSLEMLASSASKATDNRAIVETFFYLKEVRRGSQ